MQETKDIIIEERIVPVCPDCGGTNWLVLQKITREQPLIRVDGLGDLVMKQPDENNYRQAILLQCSCGSQFYPQAGQRAKADDQPEDIVEAYLEKTGLDDWPDQVENEEQY